MVGKTLSRYKILSEIGRGGMGIVYKGEDTKLHRTVAIKVLPAAALSSDDDRARFYREARAAASLSHPNIAVIHEIDEAVPEGSKDHDLRPFIAMEFIEGHTLEERIKKGPLKLEEAVRIALEVASGLEAAHKKDIVHRDIKAANVMMDDSGRAKILDFGLAQTAQSTKLTRMGSTLGTVAYMSPEQARGEEVDARTDLWALGVTLYEMVAGKHPFGGDYEQAVVYSIMNEDPEPLTAVRTGVPMELERIVAKCLSKKTDLRYQTATDLMVDLKSIDQFAKSVTSRNLSSQSASVLVASSPEPPKASLVDAMSRTWPFTLILVLIAIGSSYAFFSGSPASPPIQKLLLHIEGIRDISNFSVSPTSEYLAFRGDDSLGTSRIYLRNSQTGKITLVLDSEGADTPQFSPDGSKIFFWRDLSIYVVTVPIGIPKLEITNALNLVWENNSSIIYSKWPRVGGGTWRMNIDTDSTVQLFHPSSYGLPDSTNLNLYSKSEDGRFVVGSQELGGLAARLLVYDLKTDSLRFSKEEGIINALLIPGGYLAYQLRDNDGPVVYRPFDVKTAEFLGDPVLVIDEIDSFAWRVNADGSFIFAPDFFGSKKATRDSVKHAAKNYSTIEWWQNWTGTLGDR